MWARGKERTLHKGQKKPSVDGTSAKNRWEGNRDSLTEGSDIVEGGDQVERIFGDPKMMRRNRGKKKQELCWGIKQFVYRPRVLDTCSQSDAGGRWGGVRSAAGWQLAWCVEKEREKRT